MATPHRRVENSDVTDPSPGAPKSLSAALEAVGDRWTLLMVAALLERALRFGEIQSAVGEIATNVLASRLRELERRGLVVAHPYSERPLRVEYELTARGAELAGVLRMLATWGASLPGGPVEPVGSGAESDSDVGAAPGDLDRLAHAICGTPLEVRYFCPTCQQVAGDDDEVWA